MIEESVLTSPFILNLAEFNADDTDIKELVDEQHKIAKSDPTNLIPTIKFVFEYGFIEVEFLSAILKNEFLKQAELFYFLLLFISDQRGKVEDEQLAIYHLGSKHHTFYPNEFEEFLIENINDNSTQVAKNALASPNVLKKLMLRKSDNSIALEAVIANPNMNSRVLDILAQSFYYAHRNSIITSIEKHLEEEPSEIKLLKILTLQSEFACATVHKKLTELTPHLAEDLIVQYNVSYSE